MILNSIKHIYSKDRRCLCLLLGLNVLKGNVIVGWFYLLVQIWFQGYET